MQPLSCILHMYFMNVYKMVIAYDGTAYGGWQIQKNALSIQELIQKALSTILRAPVTVNASGRTDAGVHALGQVAHFTYPDSLDFFKLLRSVNALLPPDIRILSLSLASPSFHARFSSTGKVYHYYLYLDRIADPFSRLYSYHPPHLIDLSLLKQAAQHFIGTHDFTSFANNRRTPITGDNRRTLQRIEFLEKGPWDRENKHMLCLSFEGSGFLYKMVRNIVGTLLAVCAGKIALEDIPRLLAARDRKIAGPAAPAHALFLIEVKYPEIT